MMQQYIDALAKLGLKLTPGGIWKRSVDGGKTAVDANRIDNLSWKNYPQDNMGRLFLKGEYLVIDIDDNQVEKIDANTIYLRSGVQLPLTFYTTTTRKENIHAYYLPPSKPIPNRTKSKVAPKVDTFSYGTIFEGHLGEAQIHNYKVIALPEKHPYIQSLYSTPSSTANTYGIVPVSHPGTARAAEAFLKPKFIEKKKGEQNKILKQLTPKAYHPKAGKRPKMLEYLQLDYSLFNDTAAKLAAVAELSTQTQKAVIIKLVTLLGGNPTHNHNQLDSMIFATLPSRDAIATFNPQDAEDIETLLDQQSYTQNPVFKTSLPGNKTTKIVYIRVNKITHDIQLFNNTPFIDPNLIKSLVPERQILDKDGLPTGAWDDNVPLIELINDPYEPHITYSEEHPVLNLYKVTEYIQQVRAQPLTHPQHNLLYKTIASVIHPDYLDIYLLYMAYVVFHDRPPIVYPFIATGGNTQGGTGKSAVSVEIFSLILGDAVHTIKEKDFENWWADSFVGKRLISLEDQPQMSKTGGAKLDGYAKQLFGSTNVALNYKGGSLISQKLKVGFTISSNFLPPTTLSNRRMWALSPAHIEGATEPLSSDEGQQLDEILGSTEYLEVVQDLTNHLCYLYNTTELTEDKYRALFIEAPHTHYKEEWITGSRSFSARVYLLMDSPAELLSLLKDEEHTINDPELASIPELIEYLLNAYNKKTHKAALSWQWYRQFLAHIQGTEILTKSKQAIQQALDLDKFTANTGFGSTTYPKEPCNGIHPMLDNLTPAGPNPPHISDEAIEIYRQYLVNSLMKI